MNDYFIAAKTGNSKIFLPATYVHKYTPPVKHKEDSSSPSSMPDLVESENDEHFEDASEFQASDLPSSSPRDFESEKQEDFHECHDDPNSPTL